MTDEERKKDYREKMLITLRSNVRVYTDCQEPGKPAYHSLSRLAVGYPGYTGYVNSKPIESWTEEKRLRRWADLKRRARRELEEFENGGPRPASRKKQKQRRGATEVLLHLLEEAGRDGLALETIFERVYGRPCRDEKDLAKCRLLVSMDTLTRKPKVSTSIACYFCCLPLKQNDAFIEFASRKPNGGLLYSREDFECIAIFAHARCGPLGLYWVPFSRLDENWEKHLRGKTWWSETFTAAFAAARSALLPASSEA